MKKIKKLLLVCALPLAALTIATPIIATSCSVIPATIISSEWNNFLDQEEGFSLNASKDELIFNANVGGSNSEKTQDPVKKDVSEEIKNNIIGGSDFKSIVVESVENNDNDKIAIFKILLSKKGGLELSRLTLTIKNYLIEGTWSTSARKRNIATLSENGTILNVDLTSIKNTDSEQNKWESLDSTSPKANVKSAIVETSGDSTTLKQKFKDLIDKKNDTYNTFIVTDDISSNSAGPKKIEFLIKLSKSSVGGYAQNDNNIKTIKIVVTNNKDNWT